MAEIHNDMREPFPWGKQIPRDVGSFGNVHDYCDANGYLDVIPDGLPACDCDMSARVAGFYNPAELVPDHTAGCAVRSEAYEQAQEAHNDTCNAVLDECDRRLAAEALALDSGERCECGRLARFNSGHGGGHWTHLDDGTHQCEPCRFCQPTIGSR
jgi:hypothetical protein